MRYEDIHRRIEDFLGSKAMTALTLPSFHRESQQLMENLEQFLSEFNFGESEFNKFQQSKAEYEWSLSVLDVSVLLRDINFRLYRDHLLLIDGKKDIDEVNAVNKETKIVLTSALKDLLNELQGIKESTQIDERAAEEWKQLVSPVKLTIEKVQTLKDQISTFLEQGAQWDKVSLLLKGERNTLSEIITRFDRHFRKLKEVVLLSKSEVEFKDCQNPAELSALSDYLLKQYDLLESLKADLTYNQTSFKAEPSKKIPAGIQNGEMVIKDISITRETNNWLESEIFSSFLDTSRYLELLFDQGMSSIFNVRNRLELHKLEENADIGIDEKQLILPFSQFLQNYHEAEGDIFRICNETSRRISEDLWASSIFRKDTLFFYKKDDESGRNYTSNVDKWLEFLPQEKIKNNYQRFLKDYISPLAEDDRNLTHAIEYIDYKSIDGIDKLSQSLFLKKGYLGKTFIIERSELSLPIIESVSKWKKDLRGSTLIYGKRLSGRSTILQSFSYHYPEIETIDLKVDSILSHRSRKVEVGFKLKDILDFLAKHSIGSKSAIIIDDLELWRSSEISLLENVQILIEFMNKYSRRFYFLVSTNHWMRKHLDQFTKFSHQFVLTLCTDKMKEKDIIEAVKIRHGASLRDMLETSYGKDGKASVEVSSEAKKIARHNDHNIGGSLQDWVRISSNESALQNKRYRKAPTIFKDLLKDHWSFISHVLKFRYTSEAELRQMVGSSYVKEQNETIQLLLGCNFLQRNLEREIIINECIVDDIESEVLNQDKKIYG